MLSFGYAKEKQNVVPLSETLCIYVQKKKKTVYLGFRLILSFSIYWGGGLRM